MKLINLASLALFAMLFFTACDNRGSKVDDKTKTESPNTPARTPFSGGYTGTEVFIPTDSANKMISSYLESVGSGGEEDSSLHSLIFDADSLRAYLSNPAIKNVKVMFAHTLEYINAEGAGHNVRYGRGALTVVFGGYDNGGNYVFWQSNRVPDHGGYCPTNCPVTGNASEDLFPTN